jgi:hypothetical protein
MPQVIAVESLFSIKHHPYEFYTLMMDPYQEGEAYEDREEYDEEIDRWGEQFEFLTIEQFIDSSSWRGEVIPLHHVRGLCYFEVRKLMTTLIYKIEAQSRLALNENWLAGHREATQQQTAVTRAHLAQMKVCNERLKAKLAS